MQIQKNRWKLWSENKQFATERNNNNEQLTAHTRIWRFSG